jgi:LuxR family transcriptional regulator, maltose regulon positive regulatory protein
MEREIRGWSQARVAEAINTSVRSIMRWEQGKVLPQPFYREQLCILFGKNAQELGIQPCAEARASLQVCASTFLPSAHPEKKPLTHVFSAGLDAPHPLADSTACFVEHPLLSTKIRLPVPAHTVIHRIRLTHLLTLGIQKRLMLVSAPAGSGKTTLIAEWLKSTARTEAVAWISLDEEDNDPRRLWLYVLTVLNTCQPNLYAPLIDALHSKHIDDWYAFLKYVLNTLLKSERPIILVLDDYHSITNPVAHETVAYFLEHLPPHVHLLISTRNDPPWSLSRLRVQGSIQEIRTDQLNGTEEEVEAFFSQTMQVQLPLSVITEITKRTEGWFAGIQLLALSLREGTNVTTMLNLLDGSQRPIFDYLIEEVFSRQSSVIQDFLLQTSILECLDASSCDTIRNAGDSQEILDTLEKTNLFIVALDHQRQWYRYHHLFVQALRTRLERTYDEQTIRALYKRASIWHDQHDQQAIVTDDG